VPEPRNVHQATTVVLSSVMVVLGIAMIVSTAVRGGGPLAIGLILGVLFVLAGCGRLWIAWRGH
jgi:hypothetical protein